MANQYNVLFVCTGNAVRSIMAEAIMSRVGGEQFAAYSAGIHPAARVHPETLWQMELAQIETGSYRTKSWEMFAWPGAPRMDFVITLCEDAAGHPQPRFPGNPSSVHMAIPDPEAVMGSREDVRRAFGAVFGLLSDRIRRMVELQGTARGKDELKKDLERMEKPMRRVVAAKLMADAEAGRADEAGLSTDLIPA
jgi:arsenate reductase